jgi:hypothetical protein
MSMAIDRTRFLFLAGALAAGSVACQRAPAPTPTPTPVAEPPPSPSAALSQALKGGPIEVAVLEPALATGALSCDDSQGTPGPCPSVGPADEGICADVISKRCGEFKTAMKPRVAARAVECLQALKGNERCDGARINQCGHAALMSACPEPTPTRKGQLAAATATQPLSVTLLKDETPDTSALAVACSTIVKGCGDRPLAPTMADCRQTLSGLNEQGRADMVACATARCLTGGLLACEAVPKAAVTAVAR